MPSKPKTPCPRPGCEELTSTGACSTHRAQGNKARGSASQRGYGHAHRTKFRDVVLAKDPVCVVCHTHLSTVADHWPLSRHELVAKALDPNNPENGRGLCATCHGRYTQSTPNQRGGWYAQ